MPTSYTYSCMNIQLNPSYYVCIMLNTFKDLLCSKLCWHYRPRPGQGPRLKKLAAQARGPHAPSVLKCCMLLLKSQLNSLKSCIRILKSKIKKYADRQKCVNLISVSSRVKDPMKWSVTLWEGKQPSLCLQIYTELGRRMISHIDI